VNGYDIIGGVHGRASPPIDLLEALGYRRGDSTSAYRHPDRQAIFVGDLIDRSDEQLPCSGGREADGRLWKHSNRHGEP
jgi:hypothetical protein